MKTYIECIPCFFKQAISASAMLGISSKIQKRILDRLAKKIPDISLTDPPPVVAKILYRIIIEESGIKDPYKNIRKQSTQLALKLYPTFKKVVRNSSDSLKKAIEIAGAGNVIDFGAKSAGHIDQQINDFMKGKMPFFEKIIPQKLFCNFKSELLHSKSLLYIGDNAGETVFDRILIEEIIRQNPIIKITYVVRDRPIINDVLKVDAEEAGLGALVEILPTGNGYPGIILDKTNKDFKKIYKKADLIISKGQGNFETLSNSRRKIYFLFLIKCPIVGSHVNNKVGSVILYQK